MDNTVEKAFDKGGFSHIKETCGGRLPYGHLKNMTQRSQKIWKQYLAWCWRHNNPQTIKNRNHYWWTVYKRSKPCSCMCKYCHKTFNAPRSWYRICPECFYKPKPTELMLMARKERRVVKEQIKKEILQLYNTHKWTQQKLGIRFGVTQKTISNWLKNT